MKNFDEWNKLKKNIDKKNEIPPYWNIREIWWTHLGVNIGHEQDGQNKECNRPALVIKKFNHRLFWGAPMTTQVKINPHYHCFDFKEQKQCVMLTQLRLSDASRMTKKIGRLNEKEFQIICEKLKAYLP